jgi:hypothetical protein
MPDSLNLEPQEILKLEFAYAEKTAMQAQDDRTTVVNLYLLLVGGVSSAAVALPQLSDRGLLVPPYAYSLLFALLGLIGFFTLMKLVRLRQAWYDSALTMAQIRDFYLTRFPELAPAIRWKTETIPPPGKPWTITFILSILVALIDSFAIAVAVYFSGFHLPGADYAVPLFAALVFLMWQLWFYFFQLPIFGK